MIEHGLARETIDRPIVASAYSPPSYFFAADDWSIGGAVAGLGGRVTPATPAESL